MSDAAASRISIIATALLAKSCWIGIYREDGSPIGYRRARAYRAVSTAFSGYYAAGSGRFIASATATSRIYVEARTDFGEGEGETAHSWNVILGVDLPTEAKPGVMWLPGEDPPVGGTEVGSFEIAEPTLFGKTVRERFRGILRIV